MVTTSRVMRTFGQRTPLDPSIIYAMRCSGATLRQIAEKMGRSKERIRQILVDRYGSTGRKLVSKVQLCRTTGLSRRLVVKLAQEGAITPVCEWQTGNGRYSLWSQASVEGARAYMSVVRNESACSICGSPVPPGRRRYCSQECYEEGHKYKYRLLKKSLA